MQNIPKKFESILNNLFENCPEFKVDKNEAIQSSLNYYRENQPQHALNEGDNIWILKPIALSRGRGIHVSNNLQEILHYIVSSNYEFIAQKYIENSLLIEGRRFDIRQWVMVTSFEPLEYYIYDDFYVRLCSAPYDPSDIANKFASLANNSIGKYNSENEVLFSGNMLSSSTLSSYLSSHSEGFSLEALSASLQSLVTSILCSTSQHIASRKSSVLSLGVDIMLDKNFKPYLIEVNVSPSMEQSTPVTAEIVKDYQQEQAKVMQMIAEGTYRTESSKMAGALRKVVVEGEKIKKRTFRNGGQI